MIFTAAIVAHPQRLEHAQTLAEHISTQTILVDDEQLGAAANHIRAWQYHAHALTQGPPWRLVIEDDALPVDDFNTQLQLALDSAPADIVSLYLGKKRPPPYQKAIENAVNKARINNANWIISNQLYHAVAVAIRSEHIPEMLAYVRIRPLIPPDERITSWARTRRLPVAYTQPSLVNHDDTLPSVEKHRDGRPRHRGRTAWTVGTRTQWTDQTVTI